MSRILDHGALYERRTARAGGVPSRAHALVSALVRASPTADASVGFELNRDYEAALRACQRNQRRCNWGPDEPPARANSGIFDYGCILRPASAPPTCAAEDAEDADGDEDKHEHEHEHESGRPRDELVVWKCKNVDCGCTDPSQRVPSEQNDCGLVCNLCGCVAEAQVCVATARQKNCREDEDKTDVADDPRARPVDDRPRHFDHVETAEEARKRRANEMRVSYVGPKKRRWRSDTRRGAPTSDAVAEEQRAADRARRIQDRELVRNHAPVAMVARSASAGAACGRASHVVENKARIVATAVDLIFRYNLPGIDSRLVREVRTKVLPLLEKADRHEQHCGEAQCRLRLADKSNNLLALCMSKLVLAQLATKCAGTRQLGLDLEGCSWQHLQQQLERLNTVGDEGSGTAQVIAANAALSALLDPQYDACLACSVPQTVASPSATAIATAPVALAPSPVALARGHSVDSLDGALAGFAGASLNSPQSAPSTPGTPPPPPLVGATPFAVRDALAHAARITSAPMAVHAAALQALRAPALGAHLDRADAAAASMPPDVTALLLLRAVASARDRDARGLDLEISHTLKELEKVLKTVCHKLSIAMHTANATGKLMESLVAATDDATLLRPPSRACSSTPAGSATTAATAIATPLVRARAGAAAAAAAADDDNDDNDDNDDEDEAFADFELDALEADAGEPGEDDADAWDYADTADDADEALF